VREDADVDEDLLRALGDEVLRLHGRRHTTLAEGLLGSHRRFTTGDRAHPV
jgi:hypothetical protein